MGYFSRPATPGGANMQVQFNDAGVLAGGATLVWNKTQGRLGVGTASPGKALDVRGDAVVYSSNGVASEGLNVVNTGGVMAGYNLHNGAMGTSLSTATLKAYMRVLTANGGLVMGTYEEGIGDHQILIFDPVTAVPTFVTPIVVDAGSGTPAALNRTTLILNGEGYVEFDDNMRFVFSAYGVTALVLDIYNGKVQMPTLPTSDPNDGLGSLWVDESNGRVLKMGT